MTRKIATRARTMQQQEEQDADSKNEQSCHREHLIRAAVRPEMPTCTAAPRTVRERGQVKRRALPNLIVSVLTVPSFLLAVFNRA